MKFIPGAIEYLNNPATGLPFLKEEYVFEGDRNGHAYRSPILIDVRLDLLKLRRIVDELIPIKSAKYILQSPDIRLPNAQSLNELTAGIMKQSNGVVATAIPMEDYVPASLLNDNIWIGQKVGENDNIPVAHPNILFKNLPTITNGNLITGANVDGTDNVAKEITILPITNMANLTHNKFWIGDGSNRPSETNTIPVGSLPDLTWGGIWKGDSSNRPSETFNFIQGPTIPAIPENIAVWGVDSGGIPGPIGRSIGDSGISILVIGEIQSAIAELQTQLTTLTGQVESLQAQVTALEADVVAIDANLAALNATVAGIQTELTALSATVAGISADLAALDATVAGISAELVVINGEILALQGQVTALEISVATLQGQVSALEGAVVTLQSEMLAIQGQVTALETSVTGLLASVATLQGQVSTLEAAMLVVQGQIIALGTRIDDLRLNTISADNDVSIYNYKITNLANGVNPNDAINKSQLDSAISGAGTVDSVGLTTSTSGLTITNTPITTSGNINIDLSPFLQSISSITTSNNAVLVTNGSGIPSLSSTLPLAVQGNITTLGTITTGVWNGTAIPVANGGTGATTAANARTNLGLTGVSTATPTQYALQVGGAGNTLASLSLGNPNQALFSSGVSSSNPVWNYVDNNKLACRLATTANLTATYSNGSSGVGATLTNSSTLAALSIDGVSVSAGDRILVKNQTTTFQNGIYLVTNAGSASFAWVLTRSTDYNGSFGGSILKGDLVFVSEGSSQSGRIYWQSSTNVSSVGSSAVTFSGYSGQADITTLGTITTGVWNGSIVAGQYGGTGINNSGKTITLGGNLTTSGAFATTLTVTGLTNVTLPTSGTLVNSAVTTLSSLSSVGTITTGVWNGTAIPVANGGTGATTAANARTNLGITDISTQTLTQYSVLIGGASNSITSLGVPTVANKVLLSTVSNNPVWSTATYPSTISANQLLYSSSADTISGLSTINNGVVITSVSGAPAVSSTLPGSVQTNITALGTITTGVWNGSIVAGQYGGTGINNSGKTITLGGNLTTSGAFDTTLTVTGLTNVTLPTSGTLVNSAVTTLSSLSSVGTITTGVWNATAIAISKLASYPGAANVFLRGDGSWTNILTGALGIGGGNPTSCFLQFNNPVQNRVIVIYDVDGSNEFYGIGINGGILRYNTPSSSNHVFYAGTTEYARFSTSGLVFPTTTANRKICLYGDGGNDHQFLGFGIGSAVMRYQVNQQTSDHVWYAATSSTSSNELMRVSGFAALTLQSSSASKVGGGSWASISDARVKNVTGMYDKGLKELLDVKVKKFKYNNKSLYNSDQLEKEHIGVIAQEIENIFPECVSKSKHGEIEDMRSFDGSSLIYAVINAIKELNLKIEKLESLAA